MKFTTLIPFLLPLSGALPTENKISGMQERQAAEIIEIIIFEIGKHIGKELLPGPEEPQCNWGGNQGNNYWARAYETIDGKNVTMADMCWTAGGYAPTGNDVLAAQCLMGLHSTQATTCIDLAGSSCDFFGGSAIGNVEVYSMWSGDPNQQPDKFAISRFNSAFAAIQQTQHGWDIGTSFHFRAMNEDGSPTNWNALVRGTGAQDC